MKSSKLAASSAAGHHRLVTQSHARNVLGRNSSLGARRRLVYRTLLQQSSKNGMQCRLQASSTESVDSSVLNKSILPSVLIPEKLGEAGIKILEQFANVDCSYNLSPEELKEKISLYDAIIIRSGTTVTREVFEAAKGNLKVVGRAGVGVDNVDLAAATEYGCLVVNAPTANTVAAAEHGIALLCAVARNIPQASASMKDGKWERGNFVGTSLTGKTVAIMGFGKVGTEVARRAKGLGMNVIAHDPYASEEKARAVGVKLVPFEDALQMGDFFSLHMPLTASTKNLLNDKAFAKMRKGASIINVARGGVVDDAALLTALNNGTVARAALDVFEIEPPAADNPLVSHPNVVCTPHLGASTREAQEGVAIEVVEAVVSALNGDLVATAVNAPVVPPEVLAELQPFVTLSQGLGKAAIQLLSASGFSGLDISYASPRGDDLDTRLLRAMVIKGVLEEITTAQINLVNADLLADQRGIKITETITRSEGSDILSTMSVSIKSKNTKFSAALDSSETIHLEGAIRSGVPCITKAGDFDVEVSMEGLVCLVRQVDQPGLIASIAALFAADNINVSFMTVCRTGKGKEAIMAIGVDEEPSPETMAAIENVSGVMEFASFKEF